MCERPTLPVSGQAEPLVLLQALPRGLGRADLGVPTGHRVTEPWLVWETQPRTTLLEQVARRCKSHREKR